MTKPSNKGSKEEKEDAVINDGCLFQTTWTVCSGGSLN